MKELLTQDTQKMMSKPFQTWISSYKDWNKTLFVLLTGDGVDWYGSESNNGFHNDNET